MTFYVILNIVVYAIELLAVAYVARGFFLIKTERWKYIASFLILLLIVIVESTVLENNRIARIAINILIVSIWVYLTHDASLGRCVVMGSLCITIQSIIDELVLMAGVYFSFSSEMVYTDPNAYYTLIYISKFVELLLAVLLHQWARSRRQNYHESATQWFRILFIPISVIGIGIYLCVAVEKNPSNAGVVLPCILFLLFQDVMSIYLLDYMETQQQAKLENVVLRQNLKLEAEHIESLQESYANQRRQTHDFNNQLAVLKSLAERNSSEKEFGEYLNTILSESFPEVDYINTHRTVIDVVISQKSAVAKKKQIRFNYYLEDLSSFPLTDDDLVVILTNLIDNAIEACEEIENKVSRFILIKMRCGEDGGILYIENSVANPVYIKDNAIATTKKEKHLHGYGLKNIDKVIGNSDGDYAMAYDEKSNKFVFSARIPIGKK